MMKSMAESGFWSSVPSLVLISLALRGVNGGRSGMGMGRGHADTGAAQQDHTVRPCQAQRRVINYTLTNGR